MASTENSAVVDKPATLSFSETEYLKRPAEILAMVDAGHRVEITAADGTPFIVIFPGTIADVTISNWD
jgi:hypothetical protein